MKVEIVPTFHKGRLIIIVTNLGHQKKELMNLFSMRLMSPIKARLESAILTNITNALKFTKENYPKLRDREMKESSKGIKQFFKDRKNENKPIV